MTTQVHDLPEGAVMADAAEAAVAGDLADASSDLAEAA
jgi:hypothetical protein